MNINQNDKDLFGYYNSLSPKIKSQILSSNAEISTLGELMLVAEHFNQQEEEPYGY
ncbi:MAG: hypothetical protein RR911_02275 [Oscillospiraceae bacterium]